jgi:hypothetical protein
MAGPRSAKTLQLLELDVMECDGCPIKLLNKMAEIYVGLFISSDAVPLNAFQLRDVYYLPALRRDPWYRCILASVFDNFENTPLCDVANKLFVYRRECLFTLDN